MRDLLHKRIRDSYLHPGFQADVMKPLAIEHLMDNQVQTLSGGERAPGRGRRLTQGRGGGRREVAGGSAGAMPGAPRGHAGHLAVHIYTHAALAGPRAHGAVSHARRTARAAHSYRRRPRRPAGELQRVAITLCLGQPANVYLIDEPSAYLDSEQRILAAKVIKR